MLLYTSLQLYTVFFLLPEKYLLFERFKKILVKIPRRKDKRRKRKIFFLLVKITKRILFL